jgi:hypothetical protein
VAVAGCADASDEEDPVVARAYDRYLRWSDVRQLVPVGASPADSSAMVQAYVANWVRQQVELRHAELNLAEARKQFEAELRDYRNSLLLHAYEEELVRQRLDTAIGPEEVEGFYERNTERFDLQDDILRVRWFKVPDDDKRALKRMEERFRSGDPAQMREVELQLASRGITIQDRSAAWTTLAELRNEVPLEAAAGTGRSVIRSDSAAWFLDIVELRPRLSPAPIELVRQEIRSILLNERKLRLIERMRDDLYREALAANEIETH